MTDDETPPPRPLPHDVHRAEEPPGPPEEARSSRPGSAQGGLPGGRQQVSRPSPDDAPLPAGTLGARLAGRRRLGLRPAGPLPGDASEAGGVAEPDAPPRPRDAEAEHPAGAGTAAPDRAAGRPPDWRPPPLGPWGHVAGPADRASFFAEQARHRRATWQLSAATTAAVVLAGLPLSLVVTPIVFLAVILLTKLASVIVPLPPAVPELFRAVAWSIGAIGTAVEATDRGPVPPSLLGAALFGVIAMLLPGILTMLGLWLLLRRLFSGAGVGGLVIGLGAREPDPTDLEERQLVNVVEELAIAAGLPAPRVMLFDGQIANAATVGSSTEDAVVVVSRRLLDELDRDATQGILAHQIAAIGNGDLGAALSMVTVFRTFGLVNTLLDAPVSSSARATLWRLWGVMRDRRGRDGAHRAAEAARLLGSRVSMMEMEDVDLVLGNDEVRRRELTGLRGLLVKVRVWALFPVWAAAGMAKTALMVIIFGLLGPLLAWTWRARRYLADATAVQLTRNPDGIARGLQALLARGGGIRGGAWADHLFVVGGGLMERERVLEGSLAELRDEVERASAGTSGVERVAARLRAGSRYRQRLQAEADTVAPADESELGQLGWISVHPALPKRLKRLEAIGARVEQAAYGTPPSRRQQVLTILLLSPLIALIAVLLGLVVVLSTGLVIVFMMIPMGVVYLVFEILF